MRTEVHVQTKTTVNIMTFPRILIIQSFALIVIYSSVSFSEERDSNNPDAVDLLSRYVSVYEDRSKSLEDIVLMFTSDIKAQHKIVEEFRFLRQSRFYTGATVTFIDLLDAPITIVTNRSEVNVDCREYSQKAQKCAIVSGKNSRGWDSEVIVGFVQEEGVYLINYVRASARKGRSVTEWEQQ